jgi:hypothetical protein
MIVKFRVRFRGLLLLSVNVIQILMPILLISSLFNTRDGYDNISATTENVGDEQYSELLPYDNSTYGIHTEYPNNWEVVTPSNTRGDRNLHIVEFWSPDGTGFVSVNRAIFDGKNSIDTYLAETIQSYDSHFINFTLISSDSSSTKLADNPAYAMLYSENQFDTGLMLLTKEIGTIIGDTDMIYYVEYNAPIAFYANNEQDANQIIDSLEFHIQSPKSYSGQPPELDLLNSLDAIGEI